MLLAIVGHPIQSTSTSMVGLRIGESCNVNGCKVITWRFVMHNYWHYMGEVRVSHCDYVYVLSLMFVWVVVGVKW